jgi:putative ATP-binding cassette transporter
MARVLLHKPRFLVTDETLDATEEVARKLVISHLEDPLKDTAIINISRLETASRFFTRVLHLIKDPNGRCFLPDLSAAFSSQA